MTNLIVSDTLQYLELLGTKRNCLPFLRFIGEASDNHANVGHVTV